MSDHAQYPPIKRSEYVETGVYRTLIQSFSIAVHSCDGKRCSVCRKWTLFPDYTTCHNPKWNQSWQKYLNHSRLAVHWLDVGLLLLIGYHPSYCSGMFSSFKICFSHLKAYIGKALMHGRLYLWAKLSHLPVVHLFNYGPCYKKLWNNVTDTFWLQIRIQHHGLNFMLLVARCWFCGETKFEKD